MRTRTLSLISAVLVVVAPLLPLAAHASTVDASLTGTAALGAMLTGDSGASSSVSADASANASAKTDADAAPIVLTREATSNTRAVGAQATGDTTLRAYATSVLSNDSDVSAVSLSPAQVALSYRAPAKLLGFISVSVPVHITASATGTTSVSYPWYSFLFSTDRVGLAIRAKAALTDTLTATSTAHASFSAAEQMQILDSLHAVVESETNADAK